jgi:hypothetical protein
MIGNSRSATTGRSETSLKERFENRAANS